MLVGVEMGDERMTLGMALALAAYLAAGILLGALQLRWLWLFTRRLAGSGRPLPTIAASLGRLALVGILLTLASRQGALPLLATASGIVVARSLVVRRVLRAAA